MRGKECYQSGEKAPFWDHPRVCGEKQLKTAFTSESEGSPPRMRGKVNTGKQVTGGAGITPAYAGKSNCIC